MRGDVKERGRKVITFNGGLTPSFSFSYFVTRMADFRRVKYKGKRGIS
jgi:hypothetical protein